MPNTTYSFCNSCTFAPFCEEDQNSHRANPTVKQHHFLKKKDTLCFPKNKFKHLYAIKYGVLKTYQAGADGHELIRGFYFAGEVLGYEAIYTNHYPYSAVALSDALVCEIPYENFLKLLHEKPNLQKHLLYLMSQQLNAGSYLMMNSAENKLAAFLIDLYNRFLARKKSAEFILPMSRQDIGNYLGLTAETVSRIFSRFKQSKLITIENKKIYLLQPEKLKNMVEIE